MVSNWKDFVKPKRINCDEKSLTPTYGKFIAEPFGRGHGMTLGNSLRRILISSIEGSAVTSIKIDGVLHEFSGIPGVAEDVAQIVLNIKRLVLRVYGSTPKIITLSTDKKGAVLAKDITTDETVEVVNKDLLICTMTKSSKLHIEMQVDRGRGYVPAERNKKEDQAIGVIPIDSIFAPVTRVNYHIENTRVGQITDYDKLILEIWTNGSMSSKEALIHAATILQRHLDPFINFDKLPDEEIVDTTQEELELWQKLKQPVMELELSVRSTNCLREAKIRTIADLVQKNEQEMLKYRNFGKKSLAEIQQVLKGMGLSLGMKLDKLGKLKEKEIQQQEESASRT